MKEPLERDCKRHNAFSVGPCAGGKELMLHCRFDSPTLPSEKTARTGDKAKAVGSCANGFAATAETRRIAANIAKVPELLTGRSDV
jgi:hypothetical protein